MTLHVVLAGGGTAGHVEPALALADALRRLDPDAEVTALGTARGLENRLVPARGYPLALIAPVPIPRKPSLALLNVPRLLWRAVADAAAVLERVHADVLVGFGGYVAGPAYLAARRGRVPIVVHEANAVPGLANRLGARFAAAVATATPASTLRGARYVGMPLRPAIAGLDRAGLRLRARAHFGLDLDRPTLLVFGGSQGARRINAAVGEALPTFAAAGVQILHAHGSGQDAAATGVPGYWGVPYLERMDLAYAAADLAVCRAGAMTCAELAAVGLPAIYVPLPIGNGEQRRNAAPVVEAGGGLLVEDAALDGNQLTAAALPLLRAPERLAAMAHAAGAFGRRDADVQLAEIVRAVAAGGGGRQP